MTVQNVIIVADSVGSIPPEVVSKLKIYIVPVNLIINGKIYQDGLDITPVEFYYRLKDMKVLPTTSAPPPGTFLDQFTEISKITHSIFCVTISSKLSAVHDAVYQAIQLAKISLPDIDIRLFDSLTAGGAEGFITMAAAKAATQGADLDQITRVAEKVREKIYQCSILDTLTYLARGGRISKAAALAGNMFNIKPIIQLKASEGIVSNLGRARSRKQGIERMLYEMRERVKSNPVHINIQHTNIPEEALKVKDRIAVDFNCVEIYITDFNMVMGTHTGPGLLALAFYCD